MKAIVISKSFIHVHNVFSPNNDHDTQYYEAPDIYKYTVHEARYMYRYEVFVYVVPHTCTCK